MQNAELIGKREEAPPRPSPEGEGGELRIKNAKCKMQN
jgi:hypothetical protein